MGKTIRGAALLAVLISACGGEAEVIPPPQAPPPPAPVAAPPPEPTPAPAPEPPKPSLLELEKQSAKNGLAALNAHEAAKFAEGFAPDGVSITYGFGENKGREAIASDIQKFFDGFPDFKIGESHVYAKGETVVIEWVMNGTHKGEFMGIKPTGKPVGVRGATMLWMAADGLIKQEHRYMDGSTLMAQLGQIKNPARPVPALPSGDPTWHVAKGVPDEDKQSDIVKGMYSAFEKKSEADFTGPMADNATWSDITMPKDVTGKIESKKFFQAFTKAFPDGKIAVDAIFSVDEFTLAESTMNGTHNGPLGPLKATKKPVSLHALDVMTLKDGKIQAGTGYSNSVELLAQTGLLPKPKAAKTDVKADGDKKPADKGAGDKGAEKKPADKAEKTDKAPAAKTEKPAPKGDAPKTDAPKSDKK
ncbi:MAG TPA: ester cyclase [Polyangiaceae bacterium]|nr:ester cyclase [Polyangiaceae bacterium]